MNYTEIWFFLLLHTIIVFQISHSSKHTSIFTLDSSLVKLIFYNQSYIIGSENNIYIVDKNLQNSRKITIGPTNGQNNRVTLMNVKEENDKAVLFWCGSVDYGVCHANRLTDPYFNDYLDEEYVTSRLEDTFNLKNASSRAREILSYGVFGHIGSSAKSLSLLYDASSGQDNQTDYVLLSTATYDGRLDKALPVISIYKIDENSAGNYYIKPRKLDPKTPMYSWLTIYESIISYHPIHHVKLMEYGNYIYIVAVQKSNVTFSTQPIPFQTRIARFNKTDLTFVSYVEAAASCSDGRNIYNIAVDAVIGDIGTDVRNKLNLSSTVEKGLFIILGESSNPFQYPSVFTKSSVCTIPLVQLDSHLNSATRRCHKGRGQLVDWYYGYKKPCVSMPIITGNMSSPRAEDLLIQANPVDLKFLQNVITKASMLYVDQQGDQSIAFIGSSDGLLSKINLNDSHVYLRKNFSTSVINPILNENLIVDERMVFLAGKNLVSFPIRSCDIYETSETCIFSNDPLKCGWCEGNFCSTNQECANSGHAQWYNTTTPPEISSISPSNGSLLGGTLVTIAGKNLLNPNIDTKSNLTVVLKNNCVTVAGNMSRLVCVSSPVDSEWSGPVGWLRVDFADGIPTSIKGNVKEVVFSFLQPVIEEVIPNFGPVCGGTIITLKGKNLLLGNSAKVLVGGQDCRVVRKSATAIECNTPSYHTVEEVPLSLLIDNIIQDRKPFFYKPNPSINVSSQQIKHSLLSGGINICLNGTSLDSVITPKAMFTIDAPKFSSIEEPLYEKCTVVDSNYLCCLLPNLMPLIPWDFLATKQELSAQLDIVFDNKYERLLPIVFHPLPDVYRTMTRVDTNQSVYIQGNGFEWLTNEFLKTFVDNQPCNITHLAATLIVAQCEKMTPGADYQVDMVYGYLKLTAGSVVFADGKGSADDVMVQPSNWNLSPTIIILSIVSALVIGVMIASIACFLLKLKRRKTNTKFLQPDSAIEMSYNAVYCGLEQSPLSNIMIDNAAIRREVEKSGFIIERSLLHMGAKIGSGCFGKVFRGALRKEGPNGISYTPVAIKTLKGGKRNADEVRMFIEEALLMRCFQHEHVLQLIGISFDGNDQPIVILPYLGRGDLLTFLRNKNHRIGLSEMLRFSIDIAMGMNYLQDVLCVHRDLAARNCMLDDDLRVKVSDFGLSRDLCDFSTVYQSTDIAAKLPVKWMSPESIEFRQYSSKSDVWSYGITLWEIFTKGANPYPNVDCMELLSYLKAGRRLSRPHMCPAVVYEWMLSTWHINPDVRPDFSQLVSELQLFSDNLDHQISSITVKSKEANRTRSYDSGHHSDISSLNDVIVEDYLTPLTTAV